MKTFNKSMLFLIGVTLICIEMPIPSYAQGLEEIVVTAQKREESLQDTPIAVTAFSEEDLQNKNITNIAEVANFTPNLVFDETAPLSGATSAAVLYLRGVGQSSYQVTDDPGVGTYVDGVYVGSSVGGVLDVIDVERIEILRGPQGTLFGRNTIGGAINITTKRPSSEPQSAIEVTVGNYDRINVRGSMDIPITENLLTKFTASYKRADGWLELLADDDVLGNESIARNQDTPGNDNEGSGRMAILYTPTEDLSFYLTGDLSRVREASAASTLLGVGKNLNDPTFAGDPDVAAPQFSINHGILNLVYNLPGNPTNAQLNSSITPVPGVPLGTPYDDRWVPPNPARQSYRTGVNGTDIDTLGLASTIEWDVTDSITIKSISSYREVEAKLNRDADGSPLTIVHCFNDFEHEQFSQELQLNGVSFDSRLQWVAGVYYFEEQAEDDFRCVLPPAPILLNAAVDNDSIAAFAQATYSVFDNLSVTAGIRWTKDTKTMDPQFGFVASLTQRDTIVPHVPLMEVKAKFDNVSPRVSLEYNFTDDVLLYTSYTEGFKSGGFSSRTLVPRGEVLRFVPEELSTIEVGVKFEGFDRRLRINAAYFNSDYENIQGTVIEGIAPGTQNIGDSDVEGVELEVTALPFDSLLLNMTLGYVNNEYSRLSQLSPLVSPDGFILPTDKLANTPEWAYSFSFDYTLAAPALKGDIVFRGNWSGVTTVYNDELNSTLLKQRPYSLFDGQIQYLSHNGNWSLTLWGKNMSDAEYIVSGDDNVYAGFREANFGTPRTYGLTFRRYF